MTREEAFKLVEDEICGLGYFIVTTSGASAMGQPHRESLLDAVMNAKRAVSAKEAKARKLLVRGLAKVGVAWEGHRDEKVELRALRVAAFDEWGPYQTTNFHDGSMRVIYWGSHYTDGAVSGQISGDGATELEAVKEMFRKIGAASCYGLTHRCPNCPLEDD